MNRVLHVLAFLVCATECGCEMRKSWLAVDKQLASMVLK